MSGTYDAGMGQAGTGAPVTFVHSADWQLGMTRHFLDPEAQALFARDRLAAVGELGRLAVRHGAAFVLVAGDAFEHNSVPRAVLLRALEELAGFTVPVYLLPGNHDPLDAASVYRCADFVETAAPHVHVVDSTDPIEVAPGVHLVGVPWTSKRPDPARLRRVLAGPRPGPGPVILLAHGGTDAVYSGPEGSGEGLSVAELEAAVTGGVFDYVALGDRHSVTDVSGTGRIWYPGAPEVTAFDDVETDSGRALVVTLEPGGGCTALPERTGRWSFRALEAQIDSDADLETLCARVAALPDKQSTVLKLALTGTVGVALRARIDEQLQRWDEVFAGARLRHSRSHLVVRAEDEDLSGMVSGYAAAAVAELAGLAAAGGADSEDAGRALGLLYRLSSKGS